MPPTVRRACAEDVPAILEIANRAARETVANFAVKPEPLEMWAESFRATQETHPWLVAVDEAGTVLGFAKASPWKGRCAYDWVVETTVYLSPEHVGKGLGRALYSRLLEILKIQGYRTAIGGITLPNSASVGLHEAMGFVHAATFRAVGYKFGAWHDVGYWQVDLAPAEGEPGQRMGVTEGMARCGAAI